MGNENLAHIRHPVIKAGMSAAMKSGPVYHRGAEKRSGSIDIVRSSDRVFERQVESRLDFLKCFKLIMAASIRSDVFAKNACWQTRMTFSGCSCWLEHFRKSQRDSIGAPTLYLNLLTMSMLPLHLLQPPVINWPDSWLLNTACLLITRMPNVPQGFHSPSFCQFPDGFPNAPTIKPDSVLSITLSHVWTKRPSQPSCNRQRPTSLPLLPWLPCHGKLFIHCCLYAFEHLQCSEDDAGDPMTL